MNRPEGDRVGVVVQSRMNLRLVSSSDDRALAIRDHLLPLIRDRGLLERQRGSVRVIALQMGPWLFKRFAGLPARPRAAAHAARPTVRARGVARRQGAERPVGGQRIF